MIAANRTGEVRQGSVLVLALPCLFKLRRLPRRIAVHRGKEPCADETPFFVTIQRHGKGA
jgi:hypothetical protein